MKPITAAAATSATAGLTRATAATAASRAKTSASGDSKADLAAGKRKREALGEVAGPATNNKVKPTSTALKGKGKDKEPAKEKFDGIVLNSKATTATATTRQPLRTVAGPTTRRATRSSTVASQHGLEEVKEEVAVIDVADENAMVIDHPGVAIPALRRISVRKSTASIQSKPSAIARLSEVQRRVSSTQAVAQVEDDAETNRVFKKRRTSSEAPEDPQASEEERLHEESEAAAAAIAAELEAYADAEPEADPEGSEWDDLDAEDADDPLMVSEYVVEIFKYMKEVEVCIQVSLPI